MLQKLRVLPNQFIRRQVNVIAQRSLFIEIKTETTPNPNAIKFVPGKEVLPENNGTGREFLKTDMKDARCSPLAMSIFEIAGITGVYLGRDFISVTKGASYQWNVLKPQVFSAIFDFFSVDNPEVILEEAPMSDNFILDDDVEVVVAIKTLLEEKIRPYVQDDGGDIYFVRFDEETGLVYVRLAGSCVGCPSSSITLKNGVENMLMHYIDEVQGVVNVTDSEEDMESTAPHDYSDSNENESQRVMSFNPTTAAPNEDAPK